MTFFGGSIPYFFYPVTIPETNIIHEKWMVGILVSFLGWSIFRGELLVLGIIYTSCGLHLEQLDFLEAFGALQRASVLFSPISAPTG